MTVFLQNNRSHAAEGWKQFFFLNRDNTCRSLPAQFDTSKTVDCVSALRLYYVTISVYQCVLGVLHNFFLHDIAARQKDVWCTYGTR